MQPGPIPTLGELQRAAPWGWLWCERRHHYAPPACSVAVIRWGADVSSDRLRLKKAVALLQAVPLERVMPE
jgi:hypothetical protein